MASGGAESVRAVDTWTNATADGNWITPGNWQDNSVPLSSDAVTFALPGPVNHAISLPSFPPVFAQSLSFNDSYSVSGGRVDMVGAPIAVASGKTATIHSQIGSTGGLTKTGDGTLVLGGNNTTTLQSSGDMTISAGIVRISADNNLGSVFRTRLTGTLEVDGTFTTTRRFETLDGAIHVTAGNTLTCTANDQFGFSTGAIYKTGPGMLKVTGQSSRFGTNYVLGGTLRYESGGGFPQLGYGPIVMTDATFELVNVASGFPNVTAGANSVIRGIGNSGLSALKMAAGGDVFPTLSTGTSTSDKLDVTVSNTFGGTIGSTVSINGSGTVKLLGAGSNYPGGWNIVSGTLRISNATQLGTGISPIPVGSGGAFVLDNVFSSRTINLANGSAIRGTGSTAMSGGTLNVASSATITLGTLLAGDLYTISGANRLAGGSGVASITMDGPGTVQLTGSNSYLGGWNLVGGTLKIYDDASLGAGATTMLMSGAAVLETTNGTRTIGRPISMSGGTLRGASTGVFNGVISVSPGASVTFARTLSLGDGANDLTGGGAGTVLHVAEFGSGVTLNQPSDIVATWSIENNGRLNVSDDAQLGAATNSLAISHASARLSLTGVSSARAVVVNWGQIDTGSADSSLGVVTGTSGTLVKVGAGTLSIDRLHNPAINVGDGAVRIKSNGSNASTSRVGTISITAPGRFDLTDNKLVVTSMSLSDVQSLIASGRNGGTWDGPGIVTSQTEALSNYTSVAVASAAEAGYAGATFGGMSVIASDVLVMYTYGGDANLSGNVDIDDYGLIDFNASTGGVLTGWINGDFDYSGFQDIDDYGIIDFVVNIQGPPFSTTPGLTVAAVPEPVGLCVIAVAGALVSRRRR